MLTHFVSLLLKPSFLPSGYYDGRFFVTTIYTLEEKMASAEETQNASELEDIKNIVGVRKYYREDRQATTPTFSKLYNSCIK